MGIHPARTWCSQDAHPDCLKAPVHEAAESGNLNILRIFYSNDISCLTSSDGTESDAKAWNYALRFKNKGRSQITARTKKTTGFFSVKLALLGIKFEISQRLCEIFIVEMFFKSSCWERCTSPTSFNFGKLIELLAAVNLCI